MIPLGAEFIGVEIKSVPTIFFSLMPQNLTPMMIVIGRIEMKIIQERARVETITYSYNYDYAGEENWRYSFPCDEEGNIIMDEMQPVGLEALRECREGKVDGREVEDKGVRSYENAYTQPAVGICDCGESVALDGFTNTCDGCGRDYNMSGQLLADRSKWGAETGESLGDILSIP